MESGTTTGSLFAPRMRFDWYTPGTGLVPAKPRLCILMNMVTSQAWPYEGQQFFDDEGQLQGTRPPARASADRWLNANGLTAATVITRHAFLNPGVSLTDFPSVENHFIRPNAWWTATPAGQSDREVKFFTLSDGGHQWPSANDRVGWDAQLGVMDFFTAH